MAIVADLPSPVWTRAQWIALLSLSFAVFMVSLDVTVVVVSLPRIQADLHLTLATLQWVVTAYSLVFAGFLLSAGVLADRYGRRTTFIIGLALFAVSSGAAGSADTAWMLNLARGIQGLGAAFMLSSSGALLAQIFPGPDRTRAFGVWGTVVGVGLAFGPLIGGVITQHLGWHWIFLINLPVALAIFFGVRRSVPAARNVHDARPLDWLGLTSFSAGLFGVVYALSTLHPGAARDASTGNAGTMGLIMLIAFAASQHWQQHPMLDLKLLRSRAFIGISIIPVLFSIAYWSLLVFLPQYFLLARGLDALGSGVALLPLTLPMLLLPPVGARLAAALPRNLHFALAFFMLGTGSAIMLAGLHTSGNVLLMLGMGVTGTGAGLINAQITNVAVSVVSHERAGMASGVSGTMRQAGFVFAIALHTLIIEHAAQGAAITAPIFTAGFTQVLISAIAASAVGLLIGLTWLREGRSG